MILACGLLRCIFLRGAFGEDAGEDCLFVIVVRADECIAFCYSRFKEDFQVCDLALYDEASGRHSVEEFLALFLS